MPEIIKVKYDRIIDRIREIVPASRTAGRKANKKPPSLMMTMVRLSL